MREERRCSDLGSEWRVQCRLTHRQLADAASSSSVHLHLQRKQRLHCPVAVDSMTVSATFELVALEQSPADSTPSRTLKVSRSTWEAILIEHRRLHVSDSEQYPVHVAVDIPRGARIGRRQPPRWPTIICQAECEQAPAHQEAGPSTPDQVSGAATATQLDS